MFFSSKRQFIKTVAKVVAIVALIVFLYVAWMFRHSFQSQGLKLSCPSLFIRDWIPTASASTMTPPGSLKNGLCFSRSPSVGKSVTLTYKFSPVSSLWVSSNIARHMETKVRFSIPESFTLEEGPLESNVVIDYTSKDEQFVSIRVRPTEAGYYAVSAEVLPAYADDMANGRMPMKYFGNSDSVMVEVGPKRGRVNSQPPNHWYDGAASMDKPQLYSVWMGYIEAAESEKGTQTGSAAGGSVASSLTVSPQPELGKEIDVTYVVPRPRIGINTDITSLSIEYPPGFEIVRFSGPPVGRTQLSPHKLPSRISWDTFGATSTVSGPLTLKATFRVINIGYGNITGRYQDQVSNIEDGIRVSRIGEFDAQVAHLYLDKFGKSFVKYAPLPH